MITEPVVTTYRCCKCGENRAEGDFYPSAVRRAKDRKSGIGYCRTCQRDYYRGKGSRYFYDLSGRQRRLDNQAWLYEYKGTLSCQICGESEPVALDFHHRDGEQKRFRLADLGQRTRKMILEEIAKCDVLCANCHRKHHKGRTLPEIRTPVDDYIAAYAA